MYSYEDRLRAVRLYIKLGKRVALTIRQLGYPTKNALKSWHREYEQRRGQMRFSSAPPADEDHVVRGLGERSPVQAAHQRFVHGTGSEVQPGQVPMRREARGLHLVADGAVRARWPCCSMLRLYPCTNGKVGRHGPARSTWRRSPRCAKWVSARRESAWTN